MRTRLASLCLVLLAATIAFPGSALAVRPLAAATPGSYSCRAATTANKVQEPPPLWETTGKLPTADETAAAEATKPLCPAGEVPSAVASTHEATADMLEPGQTSTIAAGSDASPPEANPYGGLIWRGVCQGAAVIGRRVAAGVRGMLACGSRGATS